MSEAGQRKCYRYPRSGAIRLFSTHRGKLLIESGGDEFVDRVLVVDSPEELQISRTCHRDGATRAAIEKILATQLDRGSRLSAADDVIENKESEEALEEEVSRLHRKYLTEAARIASERPGMQE